MYFAFMSRFREGEKQFALLFEPKVAWRRSKLVQTKVEYINSDIYFSCEQNISTEQ